MGTAPTQPPILGVLTSQQTKVPFSEAVMITALGGGDRISDEAAPDKADAA